MKELYLVIRIVIYVSIITVGFRAYVKKRNKVDLAIALTSLIGVGADLLDFTIISSNLELLAIVNLLIIGVLHYMLYLDSKRWVLPVLGPLIIAVFTFLAFITDWNLGWINSTPVYYSNYNWLNTNQASNLAILRGVVVLVAIYYWLWNIVKRYNTNTIELQSHILYAFAFLILYGCLFIYDNLGRFLYSELEDYAIYTSYILVGIFLVSHLMILLGLRWKISS
ncbi:MAG: hypothetical protein JXR19_06935 [Bacteroidia bacterium]